MMWLKSEDLDEELVVEPLAPGLQEEDDLADAHKAKVAAFATSVT